MVFQAMAGRYSLRDTLRHTFSVGTAHDTDTLRSLLAERYGVSSENVTLFHKGRAALAEAVRLTTGGSGAVAVSGLTCYSVVQAVEAAGCTPFFVDICKDSLQPSARELEKAFKKHADISAVIIQNMLGIPVDMAAVEKVAKKHDVKIIEDLAHSAGATYADGREVGTVGDVMMLSFGKDKALDVVNGGALIVRRGKNVSAPQNPPHAGASLKDRFYPLIAGATRLFYPLGLGKYVMSAAIRLKLVTRSADGEVNTDETMPHWQARLAVLQLRELDMAVARRREKAAAYTKGLKAHIPTDACQSGASLIRVPLLVENPSRVIAALAEKGIHAADVWYDVPVSPARFFDQANYPVKECPVAVKTAARLVNVPTHRRVSSRDIEAAIDAVSKAVAK